MTISALFSQSPAARLGYRLPAAICLLLTALCLLCRAEGPPGPGTAAMLLRAEGEYEAGRILDAKRLYEGVLDQFEGELAVSTPGAGGTRNSQLRRCLLRLVEIHHRTRRYDEAIRLGSRYLELPEDAGGLEQRRLVLIQVGESFFALGHNRQAKAYLEQARGLASRPPLPPTEHIDLLSLLADVTGKLAEPENAKKLWQEAADYAGRITGQRAAALALPERAACMAKHAACLARLGRHEEALERLGQLRELRGRLAGRQGECEAVLDLAECQRRMGQEEAALASIEQAAALYKDLPAGEPLERADLGRRLGTMLREAGRTDQAAPLLAQAESRYRELLREEAVVRHDSVRALDVFWKLEELYRRSYDYHTALKLMATQAGEPVADDLLGTELQTELGELHAALGSFERARDLLQGALEFRRRQDPPDLAALPRTLNNLATAEQAIGDLDSARSLAEEVVSLYRQHTMPADLVLVEAHRILASTAALEGRYARAIDRYREGAELCERLGPTAEVLRGNLLLNLAAAYRAQGEFAEAARTCQEALAIHEAVSEPDSIGSAAFHCALAVLAQVRGDFEAARASANKAIELCERHGVDRGPLIVAAKHSMAACRLAEGDFEEAERIWQDVLSLQREGGHATLVARTLNYLGVVAERRGDLATAQARLRQGLEAVPEGTEGLPVTRFIALGRLARILFITGEEAQARELLTQAIDIADATRVETYGGEQQRALFFAQFAPAFDALVHLHLAEGKVGEAIAVAERSRNRTFLDQLRMANVDPRQGLTGPRGEELLAQETELKRRIGTIRAQARYVPVEDDAQARQLAGELAKAQAEYAAIWTEIMNASEAYRGLLGAWQRPWTLDELRRLLGPDAMMLFYYLGRDQGYLVLIDGGSSLVTVHPLAVPVDVAQALQPTVPVGRASQPDTPVGRALKADGQAGEPARPADALPAGARPAGAPPLPLGQKAAERLVKAYLAALTDPGFDTVRGFRIEAGTKAAKPSRLETLTEVLLPAEVRSQIAAAKRSMLVVVPDGPLHNLPLEALLVRERPERRYVLDELPPIVYAPSATVMAFLQERPKPAEAWTVLSVGNPIFRGGGTNWRRGQAPTRCGPVPTRR